MLVELSRIVADRNVSREEVDIDSEDFKRLVTSMGTTGLLSPLGVRLLENGFYELVYGYRRFFAANLLGWTEIEVVIVPGGEDRDVLNLIENLMRQNLTFYEECLAVGKLSSESQTKLAEKLGMSRTWVRIRQQALSLPGDIPLLIERGEMGPAEAALYINKSEEEIETRRAALEEARKPSENPVERSRTRTKKELYKMLTNLMDADKPEWESLLLYAVGDLDERDLFEKLDYWPATFDPDYQGYS